MGGKRKVEWRLCFVRWADGVRAARVLRPEQVWQLCLLLDYAALTTQQPGKVKPYAVSQRWDDDVSLWCLCFSPLGFVVFLLSFFSSAVSTFCPSARGRVSHQSWTEPLTLRILGRINLLLGLCAGWSSYLSKLFSQTQMCAHLREDCKRFRMSRSRVPP